MAVDASGNARLGWTDDRGDPGATTPNQDAVVAAGALIDPVDRLQAGLHPGPGPFMVPG